jgi:hypothetical protein
MSGRIFVMSNHGFQQAPFYDIIERLRGGDGIVPS